MLVIWEMLMSNIKPKPRKYPSISVPHDLNYVNNLTNTDILHMHIHMCTYVCMPNVTWLSQNGRITGGFFILSTFHHFFQFSIMGRREFLLKKMKCSFLRLLIPILEENFFMERYLEKDTIHIGAWGKEFWFSTVP